LPGGPHVFSGDGVGIAFYTASQDGLSAGQIVARKEKSKTDGSVGDLTEWSGGRDCTEEEQGESTEDGAKEEKSPAGTSADKRFHEWG